MSTLITAIIFGVSIVVPQTVAMHIPIPQALQTFVSFLAGAAYGLTSVAVGQPLDTVKTRMPLGKSGGR